MLTATKELFTRPSGYQISRSVRFRASASAYLNRTPTTASNRTTWTWSGWVKRGSLGSVQELFMAGAAAADYTALFFNSTDTLSFHNVASSANAGRKFSSAVYRDPAAWYHIVAVWDTTNATANDRMILFVNGVRLTSYSPDENPSSSQVGQVNNNAVHTISKNSTAASQYVDGYLTEINFIDGQALTPSSFGETNAITGVWQPKKYAGTYGTNGFYLNFSDNSAATATTIGKDYSGNGNNWTPNNISVTAGVTYDSMLDVPTPFADRGNYATLNPLDTATAMQASLASGNLELNANTAASGNGNSRATIAVNSGKWYFEATLSGYAGSSNLRAGWDTAIAGVGTGSSGITGAYKDVSSNQTVIIAVDLNNLLAWVGSNGTWDAGDPSAGTGGTSISLSGYLAVPFVRDNSGTAGNGGKWSVNFGQRPFSYTPPTGFLALNTQNLPDSTIKNGAAYMAATTYTGTAGSQSISNAVNGISFQPSLVWVKTRSAVTSHEVYDAVRGVGIRLETNNTNVENNLTVNGLLSFDANGFTVPSTSNFGINGSGYTYVGWQWNASGSTVTNTSGSISSQVRANPTAGFSVVTYTGTGANATIGHGLGVAPKMVIIKNRTDGTRNWQVYHASQAASPANGSVSLNLTNAYSADSTVFNNTVPTSTVFSVGTLAASNGNTNALVAYCFAAVAGYSAFGSYTGNGSADGTFVYLGFRPKFILFKPSTAVQPWNIFDTSRDSYNVAGQYLQPNSSGAEATSVTVDILSNGFKIRQSSAYINGSGDTIIYAAFAENPFKNSLAR